MYCHSFKLQRYRLFGLPHIFCKTFRVGLRACFFAPAVYANDKRLCVSSCADKTVLCVLVLEMPLVIPTCVHHCQRGLRLPNKQVCKVCKVYEMLFELLKKISQVDHKFVGAEATQVTKWPSDTSCFWWVVLLITQTFCYVVKHRIKVWCQGHEQLTLARQQGL